MRWFIAVAAVALIAFEGIWIFQLRRTSAEYADFLTALQTRLANANSSVKSSLDVFCEPRERDALVVRQGGTEEHLDELHQHPVPDVDNTSQRTKLVCERTPPRVLLVTAEQPTECSTATAQWLNGRAMRNRLHYVQRHGWKLYWCTDTVDPEYAGIKENPMWNKACRRSRGASAGLCTDACDWFRHPQPALLSKLLNSNITDGIEWLFWIGASPG